MENLIYLTASLYWVATWSTIGYGFLRQSGRGSDGLMLGLFLGPLGCAIAFAISCGLDTRAPLQPPKPWRGTSKQSVFPRSAYPCPYCGAPTTSHGLVTCRCGRQFEAP